MLGHMGRAVVKLQANGVSRLRVDSKRYHAGKQGYRGNSRDTGKNKMRSCNQKAVLPCKKAGILPFLFLNCERRKSSKIRTFFTAPIGARQKRKGGE